MTQTQSKQMARLAYEALEDKKARDIRILDISEISVLADYFLIASGSNKNQVQAMVDNVQEELDRMDEEQDTQGYQTDYPTSRTVTAEDDLLGTTPTAVE